MTKELVPKIKEMQEYLPDAKIPSFENWNQHLHPSYLEAITYYNGVEFKYRYSELDQLFRLIRNTLAHFAVNAAKEGVK